MNIFVISQLFEARLGSTRNTPEGSVQAEKDPRADQRFAPQLHDFAASRRAIAEVQNVVLGRAEQQPRRSGTKTCPRGLLPAQLFAWSSIAKLLSMSISLALPIE